MASCPNINSQEWKSLVNSIGEFEAYRDFFEYETIRSVDDVAKKLVDEFKLSPVQYDKIVSKETIPSIKTDYDNQDPELRNKYFSDNTTQKSSTILSKIASSNHFLKNLAIQLYKFVDANDVNVMLVSPEFLSEKYPDKKNTAGIYDPDTNVIYIVEGVNYRGKGSEPTILHEMIHALSYHLLRQNNVKTQRFKQLYEHVKKELPNEYAVTNIDEFMTGIFTDGRFIEKLVKLKPIGVSYRTSFTEIIDGILNFFNIQRGDTIYAEAFFTASSILSDNYLRVPINQLLFYSQPVNVKGQRTYKDLLKIYNENHPFKTYSEKEALEQYKYFTKQYPEIHTYSPIKQKDVYIVGMEKPKPEYVEDELDTFYEDEYSMFDNEYSANYPQYAGYNQYMNEDGDILIKDDAFPRGALGSHMAEITKEVSQTYAIESIRKMADVFSSALGVEYEIVDESMAKDLTKDSFNTWNGEVAFFFNGKVYFVGNKLNPELVFHEFSHPVIKALVKSNRVLADKLFSQLVSTVEGKSLLQQILNSNPHLANNKEELIEEVLVTAMTDMYNKKSTAPEHQNFIKELLYQIKTLLRKLFGKESDVSKLNIDTTLDDLVDMLIKGDKFKLDKDTITAKDIVMYSKAREQDIKEVMSFDQEHIDKLVEAGYKKALNHIQQVKASRNFNDMLKILVNDFNRGLLQEIQNNLGKYAAIIDKKIDQKMSDIEYLNEKSKGLVNSIYLLDSMMSKIADHMAILSKEVKDPDIINKIDAYNNFIQSWKEFVEDGFKALDEVGYTPDSTISSLLSKVKRNMEKSENFIKKIQAEGMSLIFNSELSIQRDMVKQKYENIIAELERKNADPKIIAQWFKEFWGMDKKELQRFEQLSAMNENTPLKGETKKEYEALRLKSLNGVNISKEKIESALRGELFDANYGNSFFEGYMYNTDPIIGGFAKYIKDNITDVINQAQAIHNAFLLDIRDDLNKAGYNPYRINSLAEKITDVEQVGYEDKDGKFQYREVRVFRSRHQNWRKDIDKALFDVKKADEEWVSSKTDESETKLREARAAYRKLTKTYFHQMYHPDYYQMDEMLDKDDIGKQAREKQDEVIKRINQLSEDIEKETERLYATTELQHLWREYRQLRSIYDKNGNMKTNSMTLANGEIVVTNDLDIANRLTEYYEKKKDFYEWKLIDGLFQTRLKDYEQELINNKIDPNSATFAEERQKWIEANSRIAINEAFYEQKQKILARLSELMDRVKGNTINIEEENPETGEVTTKTYNIADYYKQLLDLIKTYRDDDGQPIGSVMSNELVKKIKDLEEIIDELKANMSGKSGLSAKEYDRLIALKELNKTGQLTQKERNELYELQDKKEFNNLSKRESDEINSLLQELGELQYKTATPYYIDVMNEWLAKMDTKVLEAATNAPYVGPQTVNILLKDFVINSLLRQNKEFAKWFRANHIRRKRYNEATKSKEDVWERIHVWNITKPSDNAYLKTTKVIDQFGKEEIINRIPTIDYYVRLVKPEFMTPKIIGETVTNTGEWLPRLDVENSPYINKDYIAMSEAGDEKSKALFNVLEKMKSFHLKNQEGLSKDGKLYLDVPRYRQSGLETAQQLKPSESLKRATKEEFPFFTTIIKRIKDFGRKAKDNPESGFNYEDDFTLSRLNLLGNDKGKIPKSGVYDLDLDLCSTDLMQVLTDYMVDGQRQKKLIQMMPVANALKNVIDNPISEKQLVNRGLFTWGKEKKGKNVRAKVIKNMIEREFYGKTNTGMLSDSPWVNNSIKLLFKRASMGFFALNIPSAVKNQIGPKIHAQLTAIGGKHFNTYNLAQAEVWAYQTMFEVSASIYSDKPKPLNVQIADIFNAIQDRTIDRMGYNASRTIMHDTLNMSWLYNFRKWTEMQSTMQIFGAMMKGKKLKYGSKEIDYLDAWELVNGQVTLKQGIDVRYGALPTNLVITTEDTLSSIAKQLSIPLSELDSVITKEKLEAIQSEIVALEKEKASQLKKAELADQGGILVKYDKRIQHLQEFRVDNKFFKNQVNTIHTIQNDLQGAYARFDQPELQRYILFRFISFLRRYFTPMFLNAFAMQYKNGMVTGRINYATGDVRMGYLISMLTHLYKSFSVSPKYLLYLTKEEKAAWYKSTFLIGSMWMISFFLLPMILGYDPDDEERYKKMRKRSGPLFSDDFNPMGFVQNHLILLAMQVQNENEQFIPLPGYGMDDYVDMITPKSLSTGPTLDVYTKMIGTLLDIVQNNPSKEYRKEVGPYPWQQKGSLKIWNYTLKSFGITGSNVSPEQAVKNFEGFKARR